jgi:hypothetical protein
MSKEIDYIFTRKCKLYKKKKIIMIREKSNIKMIMEILIGKNKIKRKVKITRENSIKTLPSANPPSNPPHLHFSPPTTFHPHPTLHLNRP